MFEKAKWITKDELVWKEWALPSESKMFPSPYLAKTFNINKEIKKAVLYAVGFGQAVYFINGERVKDCYLPTQRSLVNVTVVYNTYDITYSLKQGLNRFGVLLGNDDYPFANIQTRSYVKMISQIDLEYMDGSVEQICSDSSFKTTLSPLVHSFSRRGEIYDARLEISNWCEPDFDDSDWENAVVCTPPGGTYRENYCEPIRIIREIKGNEIAQGVFDFGTDTSGWIRLCVKGKEGSEIIIRYAERLKEDEQNVERTGICDCAGPESHTDRYILKKSNEFQVWESMTLYHGFQYAQVYGDYEEITLTAIVAFTDMSQESSFECDNEIINSIHNACVNSIQTNCHGLMTDCPHREQGRWTGDACASAQAICINFNAYNMFYEWMHHFKDAQTPIGRLSSTVPSGSSWGYNFACGVDWDSAIIHIPYYAFKYSGNSKIVDLMWESMCRMLDYFEYESEDYITNFSLGDWESFEEDGGNTNHELCNKRMIATAFFHLDALMMVEMAEFTGRDTTPFKELAEKIRSAFRKEFIINNKYILNRDTEIALAAYAKLFNEQEEKREITRLDKMISSNDYRIFCGIHGARTIFEMLSKHGYYETAFKTVVNTKYPGYASVYVHNRDTLAEKLNFFEHHLANPTRFTSLNHHFFSSIETWFYETLAGIKVCGFGFKDIVIEPKFVSGINSLSACLHGISVSYDTEKIRVESKNDFTFILNGASKKYKGGIYIFNRAE